MSDYYDLIVLGSGAAGREPAIACARVGWRVLVIDPRRPGGTCANRGCDAKKPYVNVAAAHARVAALAGHGLAPPPAIEWPPLHRFKRRFTDPVPGQMLAQLVEAGVEFTNAAAHFVDEQTLVLEGGREVQGYKFVIATGLHPRPLDFPGAELIIDSDALLAREQLPRRVGFIGAGYISMEFAHVAVRAGSEVTVIEQGDRVLPKADAELSEAAAAASRAAGIQLRCDATVGGVVATDSGLRIECEDTDWTCEVDLVVHGAGRVPKVYGLGLEDAEIKFDEERGVIIDEFFRSPSNPRVYVAGDVSASPGPKLTPVSAAEGAAVRDNLLHGDTNTVAEVLSPGVASCVFMVPPLAWVGLTEIEALGRYGREELAISTGDVSDWKLFREINQPHAFYKIIVARETRELVGAHLLMPGADDLINLFALAIAADLPVDALSRPLYAYPTLASNLKSMLSKL